MDSTEWDEMYSREFEDPRDPSRDYWNSSILALPTGGDAPADRATSSGLPPLDFSSTPLLNFPASHSNKIDRLNAPYGKENLTRDSFEFRHYSQIVTHNIQIVTSECRSGPDDDFVAINCHVDWELPRYIETELGGSSRLDEVVTITGTPDCAQVASCEDYVIQTWGIRGKQRLDKIIKTVHEDNIGFSIEYSSGLQCTHSLTREWSSEPTRYMNAEISGNYHDVMLTLELLAWLAVTFRLPQQRGIALSSVDYESMGNKSLNSSSSVRDTRYLPILLSKQSAAPRSHIDTPGTCWLPLFQEGILACGFPAAPREEGIGLEIPFQLMIHFAGIRGSMEYDKFKILVGPSRILFPVKLLGDSVQWHYIEASEDDELVHLFSKYIEEHFPHDILDLSDIEDFATKRTFLGHYNHAFVTAGTHEAVNISTIGDSIAPRSNTRLEIAREGTANIGFSTYGGTGAIAGKWIFPKSLQVSLAGNHTYEDRLSSAIDRPLVVYDINERSAWLVSELSIVLHLAHKYLNSSRAQRRGRGDVDQIFWPHSPFAQSSADGGKAAYSVIQKCADTHLYTRHEDGKPQKFWNEIDAILKDLASIRTEERLKRNETGLGLSKPRLQGWDFNDLATKEETVYQRELPKECVRSPWWPLVEENNIVVLFGRDFGSLIRPDLEKSKPYCGWESVPSQAELLTASMPVFRSLMYKYEDPHQVASGLFWQKPTKRDCPPCGNCTDGCLYVQGLIDRRPGKGMRPNKRLLRSDAVIFGDIKHYHKMKLKMKPTERLASLSTSDNQLANGRKERTPETKVFELALR